MSTEDVCSILKASKEAGVTKLLFCDLHVEFGTPTDQQVVDLRAMLPNYPFVQQNPAHAPVGVLTEDQHTSQGKDSLELDELRLREERLAQALVEDPDLYEKLLRDGELGDDVGSTDEDDDL